MTIRLVALLTALGVTAACGRAAGETVTVDASPAAVGTVLTDEDGHTLYLFLPDQQQQPTCTGACTQAWPPLDATGQPAAGSGVDAGLLGTVAHPDGRKQVTYNGWPLYRYSGDQAPGEANGHGLLNVWFAVDPVGGAAGPVR